MSAAPLIVAAAGFTIASVGTRIRARAADWPRRNRGTAWAIFGAALALAGMAKAVGL